MKKYYIEELGCAKNQVDSEQMNSVLIDSGFVPVTRPENAEVIIVNTCGFLEAAVSDNIDRILELSDYKSDNLIKLIVTGCLSERYNTLLIDELPEVDVFLGTGYSDDIVNFINDNANISKFEKKNAELGISLHKYTDKSYAYIKISEGCDNRCSYCIIPSLRGKFRSKSINDIITEAKQLSKLGIKEIILVAQDLSRYGIDNGKFDLITLLNKLGEIEGIEWIRLQYLYPDILTKELFEAIRDNKKIVKYLDIPIQHISDRILKRMNRHTTKKHIIDTISLARNIIPEVSLRTTLMVGFPGETEEDFLELLDFVSKIKFERMGSFIYSDEKDAPSYRLKDKVESIEKYSRHERLLSLQSEISREIRKKNINKVLDVIVDKNIKDGYIGRTKYDSPDVDGLVYVLGKNRKIGSIQKVRIISSNEHDLRGVEHESS